MSDIDDMKAVANKKAMQKLLDLQALDGSTEIKSLTEKAMKERAILARDAAHVGAVHDFDTGQALTRAVNSYRVRRGVADLAKSEGRSLTGAAIVVPEPKPEIEGDQANA